MKGKRIFFYAVFGPINCIIYIKVSIFWTTYMKSQKSEKICLFFLCWQVSITYCVYKIRVWNAQGKKHNFLWEFRGCVQTSLISVFLSPLAANQRLMWCISLHHCTAGKMMMWVYRLLNLKDCSRWLLWLKYMLALFGLLERCYSFDHVFFLFLFF